MKIYLIGYTYVGKSTYGRQLAAERGMDFLDLDRAFEERYHYTVDRFFAVFGEAAFRTLERQVLHATADLDNVVVATGGGTPCYADNMDFLLAHGTVIYLRMSVDGLVARASASRAPRPAMKGLDGDALRAKIASQFALREPYYLRAHQVVEVKS